MTTKLCKDCKWSAYGIHCESPHNMVTDPISGELRARDFTFCSLHRNPPMAGWLGCRIARICGTEGRWFEAKNIQIL
jgi:hypothetical protein